jgi:hypothetical protein
LDDGPRKHWGNRGTTLQILIGRIANIFGLILVMTPLAASEKVGAVVLGSCLLPLTVGRNQFRVQEGPCLDGARMQIASFELSQLQLNPDNDRHGPLKDEASAIQWLLSYRIAHMRALAEDLAASKRLYEPPLIRADGTSRIVFDGNRRVCCLKLLLDPMLAPSESWNEFFSQLSTAEVIEAFSKIDCEIETDLATIDELLFRRHTGSQDGVGRSQWDPEGKSFFLQRTGRASLGLGQTIEKVLKSEQLISQDQSLPWSNFERLLSSEPIRKRAGISFSGGALTYLTDKQKNLRTLKRIADDLSSRTVVLGDLWNNEGKRRYLDRLKKEGFAIDVAPTAPVIVAESGNPIAVQVVHRTRKGPAPKDKYLISAADQNPFLENPALERPEKIWAELQFALEFDRHDNAIAVLMRVLLELAIAHYARANGIAFGSTEPLSRRVSAVADSMLNRDLIDTKARAIIRKYESDKPIVSAHSMHQYVHNPNFHPARSDLKAIWNVIRSIILNSVR